ncbi:MAG: alanine racemase [Lutibacter sp.]|nr:alanine racemase [Lutibacter sp.]
MKHNILKNKIFFSDNLEINSLEFFQHWVELSQSALESNAAQFQQWLGPVTKISGILKSNAYGHGLLPLAAMYEQCDNIASLSVVNLSEAIKLRLHGIKKPILVISYLDAFYDFIVQYSIEVVIYDLTIAQQLNAIGKKYNQQIIVHIKFDTGMSRLGLTASQLNAFIEEIQLLPYITIKGIFSHLAESYVSTSTHQQESVFALATTKGLVCHISNSHGCLTIQNKNYTYARIGIGLYGYLPRHASEFQNKLQPVLSLKTRILQMKHVSAGSSIGYDSTYKTDKNIHIAIIAIGYAEGLDARFSNLGSVIINAKIAPIIGRVCMNLTIVDISLIENCTVGQVVTVLGKEGNASLSVYDWAALTESSPYSLLTKLSSSMPRIIVD